MCDEPRNPDEEENEKQDNEPTDQIGIPVIPFKNDSPIQCLTIIGQIEGHMALPPQNKTTKYEHILPLLVSMEETESIKGLLILLNTVGGDIEAGLAMSEMIAGMTKPTVSLVLGGGHSIGVPLAVSTNRSFIAPTATMTIHPVRLNGLVIGASQTYDYFAKMQDRVVSFVCSHSDIAPDYFKSLMLKTGEMANDLGTILIGDEAVQCKLIDQVGTLKDALSYLREQIKNESKNKSK